MFRWEGPSEGAWKGVNGSIWKGREGVSGVLERGSEYTWTGNVRRVLDRKRVQGMCVDRK